MFVKRFLCLVIVWLLVSPLIIGSASATLLWQYGVQDQSYLEFKIEESGSFQNEGIIEFGSVGINSPNTISDPIYGYLYNQNPYDDYSHVTVATVEALTFNFTLENDYRQLDLFYGRFGSEIDYIFFDGVEISSFGGSGEGQWDLFNLAIIEDINAGSHALTLAYGGGGAANGHFIDFMRLENGILADNGQNSDAASVPEPETVFFVSFGIIGLVAFRKKFGLV